MTPLVSDSWYRPNMADDRPSIQNLSDAASLKKSLVEAKIPHMELWTFGRC